MEELPFKIGDKVRIKSKPISFSSALGGDNGLHKVKYPYEFVVKDIAYRPYTQHVAIFDGTYGWAYYEDKFELIKGGSKKFKDRPLVKEKILRRNRE